MTEPYYTDDRVTLWHGSALDRAVDLEPESFDCIVTSPPYYGLRDYGVEGQLGAEESVEEYVDKLVAIFEALAPALRSDGTLWLNLGDSYATRWGSVRRRSALHMADHERLRRPTPAGFAPKQLLMVPARVALALQDAGWFLRASIVWSKPNPMPESVTDRPTKAHEMVYLLSRTPDYYYDAAAIAEPLADSSIPRLQQNTAAQQGSDRAHGGEKVMRAVGGLDGMRNARDVWTIATTAFSDAHFATFPEELPRRAIRAGSRGPGKRCDCAEVIGTPTGASSAEEDPSLLVGRAGMSRPRGEEEGRRLITRREQRGDAAQLRLYDPAKLMRVLDRENVTPDALAHYLRSDRSGARPLPADVRERLIQEGILNPDAIPPCAHPFEKGGIVGDPFSGSGTTGMVALQEGRRYVGIDLNREYLDLSLRTRFAAQPLDLGSLA